jgi:glucokinase
MTKKNDDKAAIGIDLGGTAIKYALVNMMGQIYKESQRPSNAQSESKIILHHLKDAILEMKDYAFNLGYSVNAIGLGSPGCVDINKGLLMGSTPNFRYWKDIAIAQELSAVTNLPVFVDNDANLMALGETKFGAGVGAKQVICITVGTGIGGGIIIDGKLYRGFTFAGAELGHMSIVADGLPCNCGGKGCLEQYASASAIIRFFKQYGLQDKLKMDKERLDVKHIFELFKKGDKTAARAIEECTHYLGIGLANFINIFNPELIIIGGGVAEAGDIFIDMVNRSAFQYAMAKAKENVRIVPAKLGNKAGFLGAAIYAFECIHDREP